MIHPSITAAALAVCIGACATTPAQPVAAVEPDPAPVLGTPRVGLLGNYVGRTLRIEVEGAVLVDERLSFAPMGAEHRYDAGFGPARTASVSVVIEGCETPWQGEIRLEPLRTAHILIQGCSIEALAPD